MNRPVFYCPVQTKALSYAAQILTRAGCVFLPAPGEQVTHLLLPAPTFSPDGAIRGDGPPEAILSLLPNDITVVGGNLTHPALQGYVCLDLLQDPTYVCENAAITAYCAMQILASCLPCTLQDCPILVIGWGRIGKVLGKLLKAVGAQVTFVARKEADRGMLMALGYGAQEVPDAHGFRAVLNTAPAPVFLDCPDNILKIELSSATGLGGKDVILARGLPAIHAPESSGKLIAQTILRKENLL